MKILHVITTINRGGAENHLKDLIEGQVNEYGFNVACAYLKGDGYLSEEYKKLGVKILPLGIKRYGDIMPVIHLRNFISKFSPDIIHAHLSPAELYVRIALLGFSKIPFIISRHNESRFMPWGGASYLERWVVKRSSCIIAISEAVKRHFSKQWPNVLQKKFTTIYYGINPLLFKIVSKEGVENLRTEWAVNSNTVLIGSVGRLVSVKAFHILLMGFKALVTKHSGLDVKLVIVGAGPLENELKKLTSELNIKEKVVWAGFRQDIHIVMNSFDIFTLTSLTEGFGLVLLEAMASSKPVIATNVGAISEIIVDGQTGFLINSSDSKAVELALEKLVFDPSLRIRFGERGYRRVVTDFSLKPMCLHTVELYKKVIESQS